MFLPIKFVFVFNVLCSVHVLLIFLHLLQIRWSSLTRRFLSCTCDLWSVSHRSSFFGGHLQILKIHDFVTSLNVTHLCHVKWCDRPIKIGLSLWSSHYSRRDIRESIIIPHTWSISSTCGSHGDLFGHLTSKHSPIMHYISTIPRVLMSNRLAYGSHLGLWLFAPVLSWCFHLVLFVLENFFIHLLGVILRQHILELLLPNINVWIRHVQGWYWVWVLLIDVVWAQSSVLMCIRTTIDIFLILFHHHFTFISCFPIPIFDGA